MTLFVKVYYSRKSAIVFIFKYFKQVSIYEKQNCTYCIFLRIKQIIIIVVPTPSNDSVMRMLNY